VAEKSFPDLALMQLLVQTKPQTLKKTAQIRMRAFNFAEQELAPREGNVVNLRLDDLDATAAAIPALQTVLDTIAPVLGNLVKRDLITKDIAAKDREIAALAEAEGADDTALQAERTALVDELAPVETALGM
jgi:hypothetical protein